MKINSTSRPETRFSIKKTQINHFVRKKTIEVPKCRALVFFWGVCFVFRSKNLDVTKTGNGERGTGNGERGTGNGERGTGNGSLGTSKQR